MYECCKININIIKLSGKMCDGDSTVATQLVLFGTDAVHVSYSDGSSLQLSPCGAAFIHHQSAQSQAHVLHGMLFEQEIYQGTLQKVHIMSLICEYYHLLARG